jgi:hypothetical protein
MASLLVNACSISTPPLRVSISGFKSGSSQEFVGEKEALTLALKKGWDIFSE